MTTAAPVPPPPPTAAAADLPDPTAATTLPPLKPRPVLLVVSAVAFAAWVAFLIVLYATTVYPERHPARPADPSHPPAGTVERSS